VVPLLWYLLSYSDIRVVFSFGSAEKGQLGNGTTGERIATGNKTSYDIEVDPGVHCLFLALLTLTLMDS
jgi:hypothetical protein